MSNISNRQWLSKKYIGTSEVPSDEHFELVENKLPDVSKDEILVRTIVLGNSPAQRMYVSEERNFHIQVEHGEVMSSRGVGEVIASEHSGYQVGDIVQANLGWQDYKILTPDGTDGSGIHSISVQKIDNPQRPLSTVLSMFGQLAYSAYVGIIEVGQVKPGDVVLVSAAAGGVGSMACQLARLKGAKKVVGIAGGADKCQWLLDKGLCDEAIDYKAGDLDDAMAAAMPDGLDLYLDSVGGDMLDAALDNLAVGARVILCGMISTEYQRPRPPGPTHYYNLIYKRARMEGFFVFDYTDRWPEFEANLREWYGKGELKNTEHTFSGLEQAPTALGSLFTGGNTGGCVIQVSPDPEGLPSLS